MFILFKKFIYILIPLSILFTACGPHIAEVVMPTNGDYADWLAYYEDQFEAYGDEVEVPSADVPDAQMRAYLDAEDSYETAAAIGTYVGYSLLISSATFLILTLVQAAEL